MGVRVGVDTGGTFTDLMAWTDDGQVFVHKTPSTPDDNTRALLDGLAALGETGGFKQLFQLIRAARSTAPHGQQIKTEISVADGLRARRHQ